MRNSAEVIARTFADPTAQIAIRNAGRVSRTTRTTIVEFPHSSQGRKARFREKARAAINKPFANLLAQFHGGEISLREFGVQRAALIQASHKPTRTR